MAAKDTLKDFDTDLAEEIKIKEPKTYKVLLHNDDFTPMEFVIELLMRIFHKPFPEATNLMLKIHTEGTAVCGIYSFEIAESKIHRVHEESEQHGFPLKSSMEEA